MSPDEAALIRLWKETAVEIRENQTTSLSGCASTESPTDLLKALQLVSADLVATCSRKQTPLPGRNSMPEASSAFCTSSRVDDRLGGTPSTLSKR